MPSRHSKSYLNNFKIKVQDYYQFIIPHLCSNFDFIHDFLLYSIIDLCDTDLRLDTEDIKLHPYLTKLPMSRFSLYKTAFRMLILCSNVICGPLNLMTSDQLVLFEFEISVSVCKASCCFFLPPPRSQDTQLPFDF